MDADVKLRTHGYHYLYEHVPNKRERLEMIYRSMGRAHDWELEKFRVHLFYSRLAKNSQTKEIKEDSLKMF
jgi:hypothetical protein